MSDIFKLNGVTRTPPDCLFCHHEMVFDDVDIDGIDYAEEYLWECPNCHARAYERLNSKGRVTSLNFYKGDHYYG
jgi:hypothetical protein